MSVRQTIADDLKAVADALRAERHARAGDVEKIWAKLTVGLPPAEHQALEDAHQIAADTHQAAQPVVAEAEHDVEVPVDSAPSTGEETAPAHTPAQVAAVVASEAAVADSAWHDA